MRILQSVWFPWESDRGDEEKGTAVVVKGYYGIGGKKKCPGLVATRGCARAAQGRRPEKPLVGSVRRYMTGIFYFGTQPQYVKKSNPWRAGK